MPHSKQEDGNFIITCIYLSMIRPLNSMFSGHMIQTVVSSRLFLNTYHYSFYKTRLMMSISMPKETSNVTAQLRLKMVFVLRKRYSRLSLSRNRRDPLKHFEISVLRHIRFVVLRKKQFEQINFTNEYVIWLL